MKVQPNEISLGGGLNVKIAFKSVYIKAGC